MTNNSTKKRDRFVRIAEARTNKILDLLRLLGNCADKNNYEYNEDDVRQIFAVLDREFKNLKHKYLGMDTKEEVFKLRGEAK